jgi:hypothetical protein
VAEAVAAADAKCPPHMLYWMHGNGDEGRAQDLFPGVRVSTAAVGLVRMLRHGATATTRSTQHSLQHVARAAQLLITVAQVRRPLLLHHRVEVGSDAA